MMNLNLNKPYPNNVTRRRTHLKPSQVAVLQETFVTNTLPDAAVRAQLAHELGVTERTVQIWFQNRRAKARKLEASTPGGTLPSLVPNVRTGWIELPQSIQQRQRQQSQQLQQPYRSFTTQDSLDSEPVIKKRPRSSSKPEKVASFMTLAPTQRAMSEGMNHTDIYQDITSKPIISFPVHGIRIGTWARFARQINNNDWDLVCFSNPSLRQLIWQVQDGGHQFRIEVDYDTIQQIRLGQIQTDIGQLDIEIDSTKTVSFSMRRNGIDQDWVRCNDFTENHQASNPDAGSHALQGSHDSLRQSLLEFISQVPELASKLVILPENYLCRDMTISPSATPEPSTQYNLSNWLVDPAKASWNSFFHSQQQPYDQSSSWTYLNMLQQQSQPLFTSENNQNDVVLNSFL